MQTSYDIEAALEEFGSGQSPDIPALTLRLDRKYLSCFFPMLQKGCLLQAPRPWTLLAFLESLPGISRAGGVEIIQTVFFNGQPVDDLNAAALEPGCELALSAAMPGALGAIMRRGGYYASMRKDITFIPHGAHGVEQPFRFTVRVFNLLLGAIGPCVLEYGFILNPRELGALAGVLKAAGAKAEINGKAIFPEGLDHLGNSGHKEILARVFLEHPCPLRSIQ